MMCPHMGSPGTVASEGGRAMSDAGARYVDALAAKDTEALLELFAADVVFRGMTPGRFWEAGSPEEVVQKVL
jgi:ketosteroid isomerase-like protein